MFSKGLVIGKPPTLRINILFLGQAGSGKNTLLKCMAHSYGGNNIKWNPNRPKVVKEPDVSIVEICSFYQSSDTGDCELHFYDCIGFGDFIDNTASIEYIEEYIEEAHHNWLNLNVNKIHDQDRNLADQRIHLLISVNSPGPPHMLMVECWRTLHSLVNIVPVISKADTFTYEERIVIKRQYQGAIGELSLSAGHGIMFPLHCEDTRKLHVETNLDHDMNCGSHDNQQEVVSVHSSHEIDGCEYSVQDTNDSYEDDQVGSGPSIRIPKQEKKQSSYVDSPTNTENTIEMEDILRPSGFESATRGAEQVSFAIGECDAGLSAPLAASIFTVICTADANHMREYDWAVVDCLDERYSDLRSLLKLIFESGKLVKIRNKCQDMSMVLAAQSLATKQKVLEIKQKAASLIQESGKKEQPRTQEQATSSASNCIPLSFALLSKKAPKKYRVYNFAVLILIAIVITYLLQAIEWSSLGLWITVGMGIAIMMDLSGLSLAEIRLI